MNVMAVAVLVVFLAFSTVEIIASKRKLTRIRYISSPVLMPILALFYGLFSNNLSWVIFTALGFAFLGDFFMLWHEKETALMLGIGSFLLCLVFYIMALLKPFSFLSEIPFWLFFLAIPYIAYGIVIYLRLKSYLGEMKIASIVYLVVVMALGFTALLRLGNYAGYLFWLPLFGSLLFIASDTILAYHIFRFDGKSKHGEFYATLFYIPAQLLLVLGFSLPS